MDTLLDELYRIDLTAHNHVDRKLQLDARSCQINGVSLSGKTELIKAYLLTYKKGSYLYLDLDDIRIETDSLNLHLDAFCKEHNIEILALDNYKPNVILPDVKQLLIASRVHYDIDFLPTQRIYPLDFEEFLAFLNRYDSTMLSHFLQLGGFPALRNISVDNRSKYIQERFQYILSPVKFQILKIVAQLTGQKLSVYNIYERLKRTQKISKDMLYCSFDEMVQEGYIHQVTKFEHANATKKLYLCDIIFKHALSIQKNFAMLFENVIFLELYKHNTECFYSEKIDFYLPDADKIILCMPFADERALFKKLESIEAFLFTHQVLEIECITMNKEGSITHPISKVGMIPFSEWALSD
jgi:uncharacterized protein